MGGTLTLILDGTGYFFLCGKSTYVALPLHWNGTCTVMALLPGPREMGPGRSKIISQPWIFHSPIQNYVRPKWNIIECNPLIESFCIGWKCLRSIFWFHEIHQPEKATWHMWKTTEDSFNNTIKALEKLQLKVGSLAKVALQNCGALDILIHQQGGTCSFLGELCSLYVNQSGKIERNNKYIKENIQILPELGIPRTCDLFTWFILGIWGVWIRGIF